MNSIKNLYETYSQQVLSFKLDGNAPEECSLKHCDVEKNARQHLKYAQRKKAESLIIFGNADGKLAQKIAELKPDNLKLIICDLQPENIRRVAPSFFEAISNYQNTFLLTDTSIWAILMLLLLGDVKAETSHLILNPDLAQNTRKQHQKLQLIFSGIRKAEIPAVQNNIKISGAAILSPDEPELDEFISSFPHWLHEIILVWDCVPDQDHPVLEHPRGVKIINECRPLDHNFAAQRNHMLSKCSGDWVMYLDADERIDKTGWEQLRKLAAGCECNGWYFPRRTFYPDRENCRIGYGLWPDLQLRFFKKTPKLSFVNKIHEQLKGVELATGIICNVTIDHLTHLLKSRTGIESKLKSFDSSTDGNFSHQLGNELPHINTKSLKPLEKHNFMPIILPELNL